MNQMKECIRPLIAHTTDAGSMNRKMNKLASIFRSIHPKYWLYDFVKFTWIPILYLTQPPKIKYCNKEGKMPRIRGRAVVISNHTWWMDPVTLILTFWKRRLHALAAVEVLGPSKLARWIRKRMLFVDVDRTKLDIRSFNNCVDLLRNDQCLLVFPEGRFVFDDEMQPFKGGTALMALQTGAPVYPVYIFGLYKCFRPIRMAIGDPIDVRSIIDGAPDAEKIQKLNELMYARVHDLKTQLLSDIPQKEIDELAAFKAAKRAALAAKAEARARAWKEAQKKGTV